MVNVKTFTKKDIIVVLVLVVFVSILGISFGFVSYAQNTNEVNFTTGELSLTTSGTFTKTCTYNSDTGLNCGGNDYIDFSVTGLNSNPNANLYYIFTIDHSDGLTNPIPDNAMYFGLDDLDNTFTYYDGASFDDFSNTVIFNDYFGEQNIPLTRNYRLKLAVSNDGLIEHQNYNVGIKITINSSTKPILDYELPYSDWHTPY